MSHPRAGFAALLALALLAPACASQTSETAETAQTTAATGQTYSDERLSAYIEARDQITAIRPGTTAEDEQRIQARITQILTANGFTGPDYNALQAEADQNEALRNRVAALSVSAPSDIELRAFAAASLEIQPLTAQLATATPEQQAQIGEQVRAILARHAISFETYNGIAARAQNDSALAAQINALRTAQAAPSAAEQLPGGAA